MDQYSQENSPNKLRKVEHLSPTSVVDVVDEEEPVVEKINTKIRQSNEVADQLVTAALSYSEAIENILVSDDSTIIDKQPSLLTGGTYINSCLILNSLYPHQLKGINWLNKLYESGSNGLLADEMGLGKTIQVIGFLAHLREVKVWGPILIVVPVSTLDNWLKEFEKWSPTLPTVKFYGDVNYKKELYKKLKTYKTKDFPVVLTSYETLKQYSKKLSVLNFIYVVVDEGHRIKNSKSQLHQCLFTLCEYCNTDLSVTNRLLLTGTPLQNNLTELWSLLHFLLPEIFRDVNLFLERYEDENDIKQQMINKLRKVIGPFFLRRIKSDINTPLPTKREYLLYCSTSSYQNALIKMLYEKDNFITLIQQQKLQINSNILRNLVMDLRKCINHPYLIHERDTNNMNKTDENIINDCGKFILLNKLLILLKKYNHRVLLFSQMTRVLDCIEDLLNYKGYKYVRLDGSVTASTRQSIIDKYNDNSDNDCFIFLISTRAGGIGINLSSADTVIIYDNDWNPQEDIQAIDRCHRYGQTKPVVIYRLLTRNSIDTRMYNIAQKKKDLAQIIIGKSNTEKKNTLISLIMPNEVEDVDDPKEISDSDLELLVSYHEKKELPPEIEGCKLVELCDDNMLGSFE